jgi:hypothetical protein
MEENTKVDLFLVYFKVNIWMTNRVDSENTSMSMVVSMREVGRRANNMDRGH